VAGSGGDAFAAYLKRLLERERAAGFPDFAGTSLRLRAPLRQPIVDALLAARPDDGAGSVRDLRLQLVGRDRIALEVVLALPLLGNQRIHIDADVNRSVSFPNDGKLHLTLLNRGLVGFALNAFRSRLPDFIQIAGQEATVDIGLLLRRGGLDWLLPLITRFDVYVQSGVVWLDADLAVASENRLSEVRIP